MSTEMITTWSTAYRKIALALRKFQLDNSGDDKRTISEKLFDRFNVDSFRLGNKWFVRGIDTYDNQTLDPIQLFASFSHSKSSVRSRITNIRIVLEILDSQEEIFEHENFFEGCPTVMMSKPVTPRGSQHQEEIWNMFGSVLDNRLDGLSADVFHQYRFWYGIDIVTLTIFLFWIDSDQFIPLDSNTRSFLVGINKWETTPYSFESYVTFCRSVPHDGIIRDIVRIGFEIGKGKTENIVYQKDTQIFLSLSNTELAAASKQLQIPFRIIAVQPTKKDKISKNLIIKKIYKFYKCFEFTDENGSRIHYDENEETQFLFRESDLSIEVSAIVGKNGSGKSTLSELIYLTINALSNSNNHINEELEEKQVYVNCYFVTDHMYKLVIKGKMQIELFRYSLEEDGIFTLSSENLISTFDFSSFFYSIGINYSLYGLNESIPGNYWLHSLFHKNDGYQIPLVLNPFRRDGIIDPNSEEALAKSRLLAHVLDLDRFQVNEQDFQIEVDENEGTISFDQNDLKPIELVEGKRPDKFLILFNEKKFQKLTKKYSDFTIVNRFVKGEEGSMELSASAVFDGFWRAAGKGPITAETYVDEIKAYLVYKLFSIAETHPKRYADFVKIDRQSRRIEFFGLPQFFYEAILSDSSHVTFKVWQAVHYLVYAHIQVMRKKETEIDILRCALEISNIKVKHSSNSESTLPKSLSTIHLIPPSVFDVDIIFEGNHPFSELSSGEKQSIFAINTVTYHLSNLESIDPGSGLITYPHVNIIFDEVELYFHPDMQRLFIHRLLFSIQQLNLEKIKHLNIQFITHSPFILSDIPASNVLRIAAGQPEETEQQTFGANVHDLLHHDFFMKNFMGEFARQRIHSLINYLHEEQPVVKKGESDNEFWDLEKAEKVISLVGEPYLKDDLTELFKTKQQEQLTSIEKIEREIQRLEKMKQTIQKKEDDSYTQ